MILVTGATGFLGSELVTKLTQQGKTIRALRRQNSVIPALLKDNTLIEWVIADINEPAALDDVFEGVTQVYHCAALVSFKPKDKAALLRINIEGTSNIVNLCIEHHARLVHVSSIAALGEPKKGKQQITEDDYWEYDSNDHAYAISKYEGEMEVWRGIAEGLDAVIVNPSVIIGARAGYTGSGAIFKKIKDGLSYYTRGATGIVDVEDVAKSMIALMESGVSEQRFTISAENYHFKQFFTEIAQGFGVKAPHREAKPWMLGLAWRAMSMLSFFTGRSSSLNSDTARSSTSTNYYSNDKIRNTIDITFKPLQKSIEETCAGLKNS
ncbi:NAD-dependent epimerase/dehydratase family protein [Pedobacter sp. AW31-3R]|uniref:NAD-dependent epimerase/dehydratase family protein n=1 Tax=Pedobacter sp. AW31-3R TaxID=3445781 RepID=UPI003FA1360C